MSTILSIHGSQHYINYSWAGKQYTLNGDYTQIGHTIFARGVTEDGYESWADEDGNFLSEKEISKIRVVYNQPLI